MPNKNSRPRCDSTGNGQIQIVASTKNHNHSLQHPTQKSNLSPYLLYAARLLVKTGTVMLALLALLTLAAAVQGNLPALLPMVAAIAGCNWCIGAYWALGHVAKENRYE